MVSAVASLKVRCICTVPSFGDDGSADDCGWVVASASGVGGTISNVGEAIRTGRWV